MERILDCVLKRAKNSGIVAVVGAGRRGRRLLLHLMKEKSIKVAAIFDNNVKLIGEKINDIKIIKPYKIEEDSCLYIIAVDSNKIQKELFSQLRNLGVDESKIIIYFNDRDYDYLSKLDEKYYTDELKLMYYEYFAKNINWQKPVTYNEKINWEKVNIKDERRTKLADKYLVREWVKTQIGEKYLTKLYGVWEDAHDINFEAMPASFVLKLNNGSCRNIIVKDKSKINYVDICEQLDKWKKNNYAFKNLELHYKNIEPKIICEEYLEGLAENVYDYNIYCFHGEPEYIWCIKGSHKPDCKASFYNKQWEKQPFSYGYPMDPVLAPKPEKLDEMLELSRILCRDFKHVRVDWYNMPDGRILFGEMTFSTWGGFSHFDPEEYDTIFGNMI